MESSIVPEIYDESVYDVKLGISTEKAYEYTQRLAAEEGLLCGQSCGCALAAAMETAKHLAEKNQGGVIVCIFPDGGEKYLSTPVFADGTVFHGEGI
jgi:cysteine synthase B